MEGECELCHRFSRKVTEHHLVPKQYGGVNEPTVMLCSDCHRQIHLIFTNIELAGFYHTTARLADHPDVKKFLHWIKKQDPGKSVPTKKSKRRS
ncbi:HNH endonuclease [Halobacillus salinarum]|uniref:HNH endonuclease n=1 Tax=Halobacillus salinarum TaxID=2932257 RepID=A0ABY4EG74_9BACI|nr:HNH endonuclease [Halobacillus salinarum]UOQ43480.1 HNH endonuclease [Halobacillus salinarum]